MSRETILVLAGLLVALSPFVGLPLRILAWALPVLGVIVIVIALTLRSRRRFERASRSLPESAEIG